MGENLYSLFIYQFFCDSCFIKRAMNTLRHAQLNWKEINIAKSRSGREDLHFPYFFPTRPCENNWYQKQKHFPTVSNVFTVPFLPHYPNYFSHCDNSFLIFSPPPNSSHVLPCPQDFLTLPNCPLTPPPTIPNGTDFYWKQAQKVPCLQAHREIVNNKMNCVENTEIFYTLPIIELDFIKRNI